MKKLDYNHLTTGALTVDASHLIGVVNDLIDLVNSQQEAIEKLEENQITAVMENLDTMKVFWRDKHFVLRNSEPADDTHRTVTLRIPKGMRIGEAIRQVWMEAANSGYLGSVSDTDLQKALDEVQPNE